MIVAKEFREEDCWCNHPDSTHDDGFGCTYQDCPCIAGWELILTGEDA